MGGCIKFFLLVLPILIILAKIQNLQSSEFIRRHQIFLGGPRTKMKNKDEKVLGKYLARLRSAKKGFANFLLAAAFFFVVEALKTAKNR